MQCRFMQIRTLVKDDIINTEGIRTDNQVLHCTYTCTHIQGCLKWLAKMSSCIYKNYIYSSTLFCCNYWTEESHVWYTFTTFSHFIESLNKNISIRVAIDATLIDYIACNTTSLSLQSLTYTHSCSLSPIHIVGQKLIFFARINLLRWRLLHSL